MQVCLLHDACRCLVFCISMMCTRSSDGRCDFTATAFRDMTCDHVFSFFSVYENKADEKGRQLLCTAALPIAVPHRPELQGVLQNGGGTQEDPDQFCRIGMPKSYLCLQTIGCWGPRYWLLPGCLYRTRICTFDRRLVQSISPLNPEYLCTRACVFLKHTSSFLLHAHHKAMEQQMKCVHTYR
jgi:hypothetical protein